MPFLPAFLDELRSRLPLSGIVAKRLKLVRAGREFKGCCPFHNEKTPSFYVNDDKQFFHCFGCGAHGDIIGFTMRFDRLSFPEAIESLAAQAGLQVPQDTPQEREHYDREKRLYGLLERASAYFEEQLRLPSGREAFNYLRGRGLSEEAMQRFHLGYSPNDGQSLIRKMTQDGFTTEEMLAVGLIKKSDRDGELFSFFRNRVMFPVGDRRGRVVAFGARIMGEGEPKYLNSPDHPLFHKGKLLYGLSRARSAVTQGQPIVVVEGYMDVIALAEAGFHGAVAPLGTAMTEDQLSLIWRLLPPQETRDPTRDYSPILCFDGDNAGLRAAIRAVERALPLLTPSQTARVAYLPKGEDPDSLIRQSGASAMQSVLDMAQPMIDVIWNLTMEGRRLQTPEEKANFINAIKARIGKIREENLRKLYNDEAQNRISSILYTQRQNLSQGTRYGDKNPRSKRGFLKPVSSQPLSNPTKASVLRERVLLAIIVNHPYLFDEFGEDLAGISFSDLNLEVLRQNLINILSSSDHETLDADELYRHLSVMEAADGNSERRQAGLSEVLSEATFVHAGFARRDKSAEQARQGWKSIWSKHLQESLQADLQAAKSRYAENPSDENLNRLMALRNQMENLINESAMNESLEDDPFGANLADVSSV